MEFIVFAQLSCQMCKQGCSFARKFAPLEFSPVEFEDLAINYFNNLGWKRIGITEIWLCPICKDKHKENK